MSKADFKKLVKWALNNVINLEMDHLFRHFDSTSKGYITKEDFL